MSTPLFSQRPRSRLSWRPASVLVLTTTLSACSFMSGSKPAATESASTKTAETPVAKKKCWMGLVDCAPEKKRLRTSAAPAPAPATPASQPASTSAQKCWFGLFDCAEKTASKEAESTRAAASVTKPAAETGAEKAVATPKTQTAAAETSTQPAGTRKCWFGLFNCAATPAAQETASAAASQNVVATTADATAPKTVAAPTRPTAAAPETVSQQTATRKCWFGLFNCAADSAPEKAESVAASTPRAEQTTVAQAAPEKIEPAAKPAAPANIALAAAAPSHAVTRPVETPRPTEPSTHKCWFGLFTCADDPVPEKLEPVAKSPIVTVTAGADAGTTAAPAAAIAATVASTSEKTVVANTSAPSATTTAAPQAALPPSTSPTIAVAAAPAPVIHKIVAPQTDESQKPTRWAGIFTPYRIDIQQGNFISQEMAARLREGMTKEQVRFLLGAPLLTDMFHGERWDYIFRLQKGNGALTMNRLTLRFQDNRVTRIESTDLPGEVEYLQHISGSVPKPNKDDAKNAPKDKPKS